MRALRQGHRPSQVLKQDFADLASLLNQSAPVIAPPPAVGSQESEWYGGGQKIDATTLTRIFQMTVAEKGLMHFVTDYSFSFLKSIGTVGWMVD